jgi:hypothetical protein
MSYVCLLIVLNNRLFLLNVHYLTAIKLLRNPSLFEMIKSNFLDGGFLVVDFDRKQVVSNQSCFFVGKILPKFEVFEL